MADILLPQTTSSALAIPPANNIDLYADSITNTLMVKNSSGIVTDMIGKSADRSANVKAFGADSTGATDCSAAINAAIASLPNGGVVFFPAGTYLITSTITIGTAGIIIFGASINGTQITTNSTTLDMFLINQFYVSFENLLLTCSVPRTAGYAINCNAGQSYASIRRLKIYGGSSINTMFNCVNMNTTLGEIEDLECRFFSNIAVNITGGGDKRINRLVCNNAAQAVSGIVVTNTTSLLLSNSNIINSGIAMDLAPGAGLTVPSIEVVNTFFDTSTNGVRFNPNATGSIFRSKFSNCWFSSQTGAGVLFAATGSNVDGITFDNCDFYGNANGISFAAAVGGVEICNSRIAGNTTAGINIAAGSASSQYMFFNNQIGTTGGFGVNATGIIISTATYGTLIIDGNNIIGNTTAATIGTVTVANFTNYRVIDNPGVNTQGLQTAPTIGASPATITNNTGRRCSVYISTAGTTTSWSVGGNTTGATTYTAGACLGVIPPGGSISCTYTVVPVLKWVDT